MIAEYGSDWAKEEIATKILQGKLIFGIGYSEPNSGLTWPPSNKSYQRKRWISYKWSKKCGLV